MKRLPLLAALICGWLTPVTAAPNRAPNLIVILADDLGWADTSLYGKTKYHRTPNLDRLARRGMTMMTVTHEMGFARRVADLLVFMHKGKVWEFGPAAELFANPRTPEFRQFVSSEL